MNTLIAGFDNEAKNVLFNALQKRYHYIVITEPTDKGLEIVEEKSFSLILISDYSEEAIRFCKLLRAREHGKRYTIFAVIKKSEVDHLHRLIEADIDQYIIESLYSEQRLDVRLAFAERMARNKEGQFLIEQKLRESEARARSILRTTVDAIITIDDKGHIRSFNKAAEDLFQYSSAEVIGKNVKVLMPQPYHQVSTSTACRQQTIRKQRL